ncbi:hypothetical protein LOK49_LG10G03095 [Camellia lanceoleosa]|uniref:Uncharacterized protein n=1 Tax=Camellia lanceoleosa TaxID=1840588 RepID=A0ACC0GDZ1_9ERIC|nr:hypothetical protein LOK49_LG10G03095 [Camellia lanceoleosa]
MMILIHNHNSTSEHCNQPFGSVSPMTKGIVCDIALTLAHSHFTPFQIAPKKAGFDGLNYSLSASLGGSLATQASEQKKKHENTDQEEIDEEAHMHEEPECPLKRLCLRNQNDHVLPSFGLGETSSRGPPKVEEADLPETCPRTTVTGYDSHHSHLLETKESNLSCLSPCQYRIPFATRRTESDLVSPPVRLTGKGKEPLLPEIAPRISVRSPHAVRLKEPMVDTGIVLHPSRTYMILPLSKENSSANGSIGASDGPEHIVSQSVDGKARNDGVLASSNERRTDCKLAYNVDGSSSNLDVASSHYGEVKISSTYPSFYVIKLMKDMLEYFLELGTDSANKSQETIMPAIDLLKQSNALDALGARVKPFGASNGSVITPHVLLK